MAEPSQAADVQCGRALSPGEDVVWEGRPSAVATALHVLHAPWIGAYFVIAAAVGVGVSLQGGLPLWVALEPLAPGLLTVAAIVGLGALIARSTHYVVTTRRVILRYGLALPRSLSLPFSQIVELSAATRRDGSGDIALALRDGIRMPYLKLWPFARAWHIRRPQPMLRDVTAAADVARLLSRALREKANARPAGQGS